MFKNKVVIPYYNQFTCRCGSIVFHIITVPSGPILHLAFSAEEHERAIKELVKMIPGIAGQQLLTGESFGKNLLLKVITGRGVPKVDFINNPFLTRGSPFQKKIWEHISRIKPGETRTYGQLAAMAGYAGAARATGHACNRNPLALIIPCHRVVAANGPGGFAVELSVKLKLLELEMMARS